MLKLNEEDKNNAAGKPRGSRTKQRTTDPVKNICATGTGSGPKRLFARRHLERETKFRIGRIMHNEKGDVGTGENNGRGRPLVGRAEKGVGFSREYPRCKGWSARGRSRTLECRCSVRVTQKGKREKDRNSEGELEKRTSDYPEKEAERERESERDRERKGNNNKKKEEYARVHAQLSPLEYT